MVQTRRSVLLKKLDLLQRAMFTCKTCYIQFYSKFCLNLHYHRHKRSSLAKTKLVCNVCGKDFTKLANFLCHKTLHWKRQVVQVKAPLPESRASEDNHSRSRKKVKSRRKSNPRKIKIPQENQSGIELQRSICGRTEERENICNNNGEKNDLKRRETGISCTQENNDCSASSSLSYSPELSVMLQGHHTKTPLGLGEGRQEKTIAPENENDSKQKSLVFHFSQGEMNCPVCGKYFTKRWSLERHHRGHFDTRPYQCHICDALFKESGHLNQHLVTHRQSKPFQCELCCATFTRNGSLKNHKHKVHHVMYPDAQNPELFVPSQSKNNVDMVKRYPEQAQGREVIEEFSQKPTISGLTPYFTLLQREPKAMTTEQGVLGNNLDFRITEEKETTNPEFQFALSRHEDLITTDTISEKSYITNERILKEQRSLGNHTDFFWPKKADKTRDYENDEQSNRETHNGVKAYPTKNTKNVSNDISLEDKTFGFKWHGFEYYSNMVNNWKGEIRTCDPEPQNAREFAACTQKARPFIASQSTKTINYVEVPRNSEHRSESGHVLAVKGSSRYHCSLCGSFFISERDYRCHSPCQTAKLFVNKHYEGTEVESSMKSAVFMENAPGYSMHFGDSYKLPTRESLKDLNDTAVVSKTGDVISYCDVNNNVYVDREVESRKKDKRFKHDIAKLSSLTEDIRTAGPRVQTGDLFSSDCRSSPSSRSVYDALISETARDRKLGHFKHISEANFPELSRVPSSEARGFGKQIGRAQNDTYFTSSSGEVSSQAGEGRLCYVSKSSIIPKFACKHTPGTSDMTKSNAHKKIAAREAKKSSAQTPDYLNNPSPSDLLQRHVSRSNAETEASWAKHQSSGVRETWLNLSKEENSFVVKSEDLDSPVIKANVFQSHYDNNKDACKSERMASQRSEKQNELVLGSVKVSSRGVKYISSSPPRSDTVKSSLNRHDCNSRCKTSMDDGMSLEKDQRRSSSSSNPEKSDEVYFCSICDSNQPKRTHICRSKPKEKRTKSVSERKDRKRKASTSPITSLEGDFHSNEARGLNFQERSANSQNTGACGNDAEKAASTVINTEAKVSSCEVKPSDTSNPTLKPVNSDSYKNSVSEYVPGGNVSVTMDGSIFSVKKIDSDMHHCTYCMKLQPETHICRRTEDYPFKCEICCKKFKHRHFYEKHLGKKHPT